MRLLLTLALCGLAASMTIRERPVTYNYDVQVATGVQETSDLFSVFRLQSQITLRPTSDRNQLIITADNVKILEAIKPVPQPQNLQPITDLRWLKSAEVFNKVKAAFRRPFKVQIDNQGVIQTVFFQDSEPNWSMNLKKGFLNMLQVNYEKVTDMITNRLVSSVPTTWSKEIMESSVAGVCKTFYDVRRTPFPSKEAAANDMLEYRVTKTIDFNKCKQPVDNSMTNGAWWNAFFQADDCTDSRQDMKNVMTVNNVAEYSMLRSSVQGQSSYINRAISRTTHTVSPFRESKKGSQRVYTVQKLVKITPRSRPVQPSVSREELKEHRPLLRLVHQFEVRENYQAIKKQLKTLTTRMAERITDQSYRKTEFNDDTHTMVMLCKQMKEEDLKNFILMRREFRLRGVSSKQMELMCKHHIDILSGIGNREAIKVLVDLVKMQTEGSSSTSSSERSDILQYITGVRGAALMQKLIAISRVDRAMLRSMLTMVSSPSFKRHYLSEKSSPQIYKSAWLATGALFNIYFAKQEGVEPVTLNPKVLDLSRDQLVSYREQLIRENRALKREFVETVKRMMDEHQCRLLALKVVRNSGLFEFFPKVQKLFMQLTSDKDRYLRSECIQACIKMVQIPNHAKLEMNMRPEARVEERLTDTKKNYLMKWQQQVKQIRTFLVNIATEPNYDPQIRIDAYRICIESKPDQPIVRIIINQLMVEKSQQVYNYVKHHLEQFSNTQNVCYQSLAARLRPLMSLMTKKTSGLGYSTHQQFPVWLREHQMGAILESDIIYSDKSFTPRRASTKVDVQVLGRNVQLMEIGVHTEGLQKMLEAAFGPDGRIHKMQSSDELLRRSPRSISSSDPLKTEELRIQSRRLREEPRLHAYLNMFGYTMAIWEPNTQDIQRITRDGKLDVSSFTGLTKRDMTFNELLHGHTFMPSPSGFFVELNSGMHIFQNTKASMNLPSTAEPRVIKGSLMIQPQSHVLVTSRLSCNLQVLRYSTQWATNINVTPKKLSLRWRLDFNKRGDSTSSSSLPKIELSWSTPQQMTTLFNAKNRLFNLMENKMYSPDFGVRNSRTVQNLQHRQSLRQVKQMSENVLPDFFKFLGMKIQFSSEYHGTRPIRQPPVLALMGPGQLTVKCGNTLEEGSKATMMTIVIEPLNFRKLDSVISPIRLRLLRSTSNKFTSQDMLPMDIPTSELQEILKLKMDSYRKVPTNFQTLETEIVIVNKFDRSNIKTVHMCQIVELPKAISTGFLQNLSIRKMVDSSRRLQVRTKLSFIPPSEDLFNREPLRHNRLEGIPKTEILKSVVTKKIPQNLIELIERNSMDKLQRAWPLLRECRRQASQSVRSQTGPACFQLAARLNALSQIEMTVQFKNENIPNFVKRQLTWFFNTVRDISFQSRTETSFKRSSAERIVLKWWPSAVTNTIANMDIQTPSVTEKYRNMRLPIEPAYWRGVFPISVEMQQQIMGKRFPPTCLKVDNHIQTIDGVLVTVPRSLTREINEKQCPVLLARDCSNKKKFQVLVKTATMGGNNVEIVHVEVNNNILHFIRPMTGYTNLLKLQRNNRDITENEINLDNQKDVRLVMKDSTKPWKKMVITRKFVRSSERNFYVYRLNVPNLGLSLSFLGDRVPLMKITVSPFYNNKICGLCGDFNTEMVREFKTPNGYSTFRTPSQFVRGYITPLNSQCAALRQMSATDVEPTVEPSDYDIRSRSSEYHGDHCHISVDRQLRIKTFKDRLIPISSGPVVELLRRSSCQLTLLNDAAQNLKVTGNMNSIKIYKQNRLWAEIFLQQDNRKVLVHNEDDSEVVDSLEKKISTSFGQIKVNLDRVSQPDFMRVQLKTRESGELRTLVNIRVEGGSLDLQVQPAALSRVSGLCEDLADVHIRDHKRFLDDFSDRSEACKATKQLGRSCTITKNKVQPFIDSMDSRLQQIPFLSEDLRYKLRKSECPILVAAAVLPRVEVPVRVWLRPVKHESRMHRKYEIEVGKMSDRLIKLTVIQPMYRTPANEQRLIVKKDGVPISLDTVKTRNFATRKLTVRMQVSDDESRQVDIFIPALQFVFTINNRREMRLRLPQDESNSDLGLCNIDEQSHERNLVNPEAVLSRAIEHVQDARLRSRKVDEDVMPSYRKEKCQKMLQKVERSSQLSGRTCEIKREGSTFKINPFQSSRVLRMQLPEGDSLSSTACPFVFLNIPDVIKITVAVTNEKSIMKITDLRQTSPASSLSEHKFKTIRIQKKTGRDDTLKVDIDGIMLDSGEQKIRKSSYQKKGIIQVNRFSNGNAQVAIKLTMKDSYFGDRYVPVIVMASSFENKPTLNVYTNTDVVTDSMCVMDTNTDLTTWSQWKDVIKGYLDSTSDKYSTCERLLE